nr:PREDICTED: tumor necrosis factor receptor superfamily member 16-like [Latimeria chalumnae]|eukprot:XP_006003328.1 PREDICTED: tumor necrosis factor receptor superfamily member 16-like [Latimeria chalumnae]
MDISKILGPKRKKMEINTFVVLLLGVVSVLSAKEPCPSNKYTTSGECCLSCPLGEGVVQQCGVNQTVCAPCLDSVNFSDVASHTEACKPCTECTGLKRMTVPCMETDDTVCLCGYNYFEDENEECKPCTTCQYGEGLLFQCRDKQDTVCEKCPEDTFSDQVSNMDPCLPCTLCEDDEILVQECTAISDTVCRISIAIISATKITSNTERKGILFVQFQQRLRQKLKQEAHIAHITLIVVYGTHPGSPGGFKLTPPL